jgi:hypothetical protein
VRAPGTERIRFGILRQVAERENAAPQLRFPLKSVSVARSATAVALAAVITLLTGCGYRPYKTTENQFAGRAVPPSKLTQRVMVAITHSSLIAGALEILDAKRDIRSTVYQANSTFSISSFSANAEQIINYPEQTRGYVYSADGSVTTINYSTEAGGGATAASQGLVSSYFVPSDVQAVFSTSESTGTFTIAAPGASSATGTSLATTYQFPIANVYKVVANPSHSVVLLFLRNSDMVYRLLFIDSNEVSPPNSLSCQPLNKPVYCIVPVGSTQSDGTVREPSFHRPFDAYFSPDGTQVYIMSCGAECGGTAANGNATAEVNFANLNMLRFDYYPGSTYVTPITSSTVVPGGATAAISDGNTVYVAGQSLQADGLYGGNLSLIPLSTKTVSQSFSIADGTHTKMLFADNNTLWIGAQNCASGERAAHNQNYNCLTRYDITNKAAGIVPAATPGTNSVVPYPNENLDQYYYGSLTGLCWVEGLNKVYTAYGGQVHAFHTVDGSELDNSLFTVQGTAMDVAYMDASTNVAN